MNPFTTGVVAACFAAGPAFASAMMAAWLVEYPPKQGLNASDLPLLALMLLKASVVGAFVAVGPILVGANLMRMLASVSELARAPTMWLLVGAAIGVGLAYLASLTIFGIPSVTIALIVTSSLCAFICRFPLSWE